MVSKEWMEPPLDSSVTLKIGKNGLEARKLWPLDQGGGGVIFTEKSQANSS
jgi:hypothetical protein